jgi:pimeloyl-ACP methyl ester carboxylesterase
VPEGVLNSLSSDRTGVETDRRKHMSTQRTHHATTSDGVTIAGAVHGQGPPLVFVQGALGDGDLDWDPLMGRLPPRFTCHLPSWRGRGLSGNHSDLSFGRMVHDILAYVDSIEEPTGLVGWSFGANLALVAATQSDAIRSVAVIGPVAMGLADEQEQATFGEAVARTGELAAQGSLKAAARAIAGLPFNDEEVALAQDAGYLEAIGRYVPSLLDLLQQWMGYQGPTVDDPAVLGAISAPVLVLPVDSSPLHRRSALHVAEHVPDARVHEIPSAGHAAPLTHPEALAEALADFFTPA